MVVGGLGWIDKQGYGCLKQSVRISARPDRKRFFRRPFEGFGRLDAVSKRTCYAVALTLKDAGFDYPLKESPVGLIAASHSGCLDSDIRHFQDYLDHGRTLARANLFIYTLPSSPLSEAAIHFGFQGPLFHLTEAEGSLTKTLEAAQEMISLDEAAVMLVGTAEKDEAAFLLLVRESEYTGDVLCDPATAESLVGKGQGLSGLIEKFSR